MSGEEIIAAIVAKGEKIRELKQLASKEELKPHVDELLALKQQYKAVTGEDYIAPGTQGSKKDKKKADGPAAAGEPDARAKKKQQAREKQEREAAEKKAEQSQQIAKSADEEVWRYGDAPLVQSQNLTDRRYIRVEELTKARADQTVWVRARVHTSRAVGKGAFLLMRQSFFTVQAVMFQGGGVSKGMVKYATSLSRESVVDIRGTVTVAPTAVGSATQSDVELKVEEIHAVSAAAAVLPLSVEDAARPDASAEGAVADGEEYPGGPTAQQETRLDFRWIDLRTPANQAIFRLESGVCQLFREFMVSRNFVEIHSPKLIGGASEGGANVFNLEYFGRPACLAQSPQLYKQMAAACGGLERVFEIGPVFRAEKSNTHRHLCEFTGLDFEMTIQEHYYEVLETLAELFIFIFDELNARYPRELAAVAAQFPFEPLKYCRPALRLTYREGIQLLRDAGHENADPDEDLSTELEKALGKIVKEKYDTDFFMMDKYPLAARPFYTMPCPDDPTRSNSFDLFIRGEEIVSGAQRVHEIGLLEERAKHWGIPLHTIGSYLEAFKHGAEPHGGGGIGLERVVMLFLGLKNIRKTSMFPRDPKRLSP